MQAALRGTQFKSVASLPRRCSRQSLRVQAAGKAYPSSDWINRNPLVLVVSFLGWTVPANIPTPALGGNSLFGLFLKSISDELSHWPRGPYIEDEFWTWMLLYHMGLFAVLMFG